jgi:membrane protein implicated in regulation of membrane protease activity
MLAVYTIATIVGGGLVLLSALGGLGHHASVDGGADGFDHSHSGDSGDGAAGASHDFWIPFLSLRFWTYFAAAFGGMGLALTFLKMSSEPVTGIVAAAVGVALGLTVSWIMRILPRVTMHNTVLSDDFVGKEARVLVAGEGAQPGKIRVSIKGELIDILARREDGGTIATGETVVVIGLEGNEARVARMDELMR